MSQIGTVYEEIQLLLDQLGSELHAMDRDTAGGHYVDGARRMILEGMERACRLVCHQVDTLDVYNRSIEGINLADPTLQLPEPYSAEHLNRASGVHPAE